MRSFFVGLKEQDVRAAARVGLSVGLPVYVICLLGRLDIEVFAAFGALTSLYGHSESAKRRLETQLVVGARYRRILIGRGRDAADVAISTAFGIAKLARFEVITQEKIKYDR
jgi:hypothetical protein